MLPSISFDYIKRPNIVLFSNVLSLSSNISFLLNFFSFFPITPIVKIFFSSISTKTFFFLSTSLINFFFNNR
ncbi:BDN_1c_G0019920.mRNA.1.CDS.1 [Saccharomyces cerevisiae]|nr:BDN_1c_G0019920.mRNA.1.CDS.1 [Saccharomyces cerevisiae]CAI7141568.1 BDN_1c_G0019920.mRNA.1.CDS.1 [Saccharomyces cerevisiae]